MIKIQKNIIVILLVVVNCDVNNYQNENEVKNIKSIELLENILNFKRSTRHINVCYNLKMWKRRRREEHFNDIDTLRIKRSPVEFDAGTEKVEIKPRTMDSVYVKFIRTWPVHLWHEYGLFTDDYILMINEHWLSFAPSPPSLYYTLGGVYIVMAMFGCTGNAVVILMYFRCRTLRTPGNILVANLALSDFLMLAKTPIFIVNSFYLGPVLGKTGCVIYGFLGGLSGTTSIATLTAIALDRYWAVVYPLQPLRALTAIRARLLAVGSWLYAAIFATIPALDIGYGRYVPEGFLTSCSFDYLTDELPPRYFIFVFFCAGWLAPLCTIAYCYTNILRIVVCQRNMQNKKNQGQRMSSRHVKEQTKRKAEIKLAVLVIVVIALFFASWTPYAVLALLGIFGQKDLITPITSMIPALFCKTAACINPFIYIITHPKFRKELQKLLFKDKSRRMAGTIRTVANTESNKIRRPSKESETDVEVIEMKDIPYQNQAYTAIPVETVSGKVSGRSDSQRSHTSISMRNVEENVVTPPSWFSKPQFSKKRSFSRSSSKKSF